VRGTASPAGAHGTNITLPLPIGAQRRKFARPARNSFASTTAIIDHAQMIVTHTRNAHGQRRLYLGSKGSLECYLEPKPGGQGWTFHLETAVAGNALTDDDKHAYAIHMLKALADELDVVPADLATVPFDMIAVLHTADPYAGRRVPKGRRAIIDNAFFTTVPGSTLPRSNYE
jgi:hypothetical protein